MRHRRFTHLFRRHSPAAHAIAAAMACGLPRLLHAQSPLPMPQSAPAGLTAYRTPAIALVQPPNGGTVTQDKPVVMFRFIQGEPDDQLDLRSFAVAVDGKDVTPAFQIAGSDAWGSMAGRADASPLSLGAHEVSAQLCSSRGACAIARATVTVLPPLFSGALQSSATAPATASLKRRILDAALNATRRLLTL